MSFNNQIDKKNTIFFGGRTRLNTLEGIKKSVLSNFDLIVLSGESGTGKSVFVEKIIKDLHGDIFPLVLHEPEATYEALITEICTRFNINEVVAAEEPMALENKQQLLEAYLERQVAINRRVVLVIDNAHTINIAVLASLVELANSEKHNRQLFKIVLVGDLSLNTIALSPETTQLIGKQPEMFQLNPLGHEEIKMFMRLRMNQARFKERELFSPPLLSKVASSTQGLLNGLDSLLDSVLLFADGNNKISLANFNEAFDFFTLLVRPSVSVDTDAPAKNLFYADNKPAKSSLIGSIKDKVRDAFRPHEDHADKDYMIVSKPVVHVEPIVEAENSHVTEGPVLDKSTAELDFELSEMALQAIAEITHKEVLDDAASVQVLENSPAEITQELSVTKEASVIDVEVTVENDSELEAIKNSANEGRNFLKNLITAYENEIPDIFDNPIDALIAAEAIEHPENVSFIDSDVVTINAQQTEIMEETTVTPSDSIGLPEINNEVLSQPFLKESVVQIDEHAKEQPRETSAPTLVSVIAPSESHASSITITEPVEVVQIVKNSESPISNSINLISNKENSMSKSESLGQVLKAFKDSCPDVEATALISDDGLMIASVLPHDLEEAKVGGMSATLLSLGTRCASVLNRGKVEEIIVRGDLGYSILINAGRGTMLLAVTHSDAKLGLITFDMRDAIEKIAQIL